MSHCQSQPCGRQILDDWICCPYCGTPANGAAQEHCPETDHEFSISGPHCIACGFHPERGSRGQQRSMNVLWAGVFAVCFAGLVGAGVLLNNVGNFRQARVIAMFIVILFIGCGYSAYRIKKIR